MKGDDTHKEKVVRALPNTEPMTKPESDPAVAALFELHHERIYRVARRITGSAEDAEDVLQTVFLRLLRREDPVPRPDAAASYLHRAATNAALDVLRRRKAARSEPIEDPDRLVHGEPGPEDARRGAELGERVRRALGGLSPRAAEMFVLRHFDGYANREIARMLGTSWSTVAVTLHRTRARLQKYLKGDRS